MDLGEHLLNVGRRKRVGDCDVDPMFAPRSQHEGFQASEPVQPTKEQAGQTVECDGAKVRVRGTRRIPHMGPTEKETATRIPSHITTIAA